MIYYYINDLDPFGSSPVPFNLVRLVFLGMKVWLDWR